ncbi:MAG: hypothetical protein M3297_01010 [Thermoproteota archaeon]|jgi:hypothetical protein|nr:hypothetical protein [Thermoproteota archaeon]
MHSEIQSIAPYYSKLENILPEELPEVEITEVLGRARNELTKIIEEDLKKIKDLAARQNKSIAFNEFTKPPSVIRMAFYIESDPSYDDVSFYYAHWTMSLSTLQSLAQSVINMSTELKTNYNNYLNTNTQRQEKGIAFNRFIRSYQEFYGYLVNIRNTITQYYDLFVQTCNKIDPNNKEQTLIAYKSDIGHDQLLAATKELLLHGNWGRLAGFVLLRSAVEIFVTRELFDPKKSKKYNNNQIIFPGKDIPSLKSIWKKIEKLHLERYFKTDSLKRLYAWQSIVAHRGSLAEEYLIWFIYYHTTIEIIGAFKANLRHYGDQILDELLKDGLILIQ